MPSVPTEQRDRCHAAEIQSGHSSNACPKRKTKLRELHSVAGMQSRRQSRTTAMLILFRSALAAWRLLLNADVAGHSPGFPAFPKWAIANSLGIMLDPRESLGSYEPGCAPFMLCSEANGSLEECTVFPLVIRPFQRSKNLSQVNLFQRTGQKTAVQAPNLKDKKKEVTWETNEQKCCVASRKGRTPDLENK